MRANVLRLLPWLIASILLAIVALYLQSAAPGNLVAVTVYKMHLMSLGGWGGYWLDRALFPYDRPHECLLPEAEAEVRKDRVGTSEIVYDSFELVERGNYGMAMIRRAVIVAASLLCVGLGA